MQTFDFGTGRNDQEVDNSDQSFELSGRCPDIQYWDHDEPKLLVCKAVLSSGAAAQDDRENCEVLVSTLTVV